MTIPFIYSRILKFLLTISLVTILSACNTTEIPVHTGEKIMTELTQTMRPICIGRLIFEIPAAAKLEDWNHEVDEINVNSISPPSLNQKSFDAKVSQLESKLKTSPHKTEGVLLKSKTQISPERILFISRESNTDTKGYQVEALFWQSNIEYQFKDSTTNKYLEETTEIISKLMKSFIAIPSLNPSNAPPGFCLENGVLTDTGKSTEFRGEVISVKGRIEDYPGLEFDFSTSSTNRKNEDPTLLERNARSLGLGDAIGIAISNSTKFLRKGKRTLNGQSGEELVLINNLDGEISMHANAEFYGEPNILDKPVIRISATYYPQDANTQEPNSKTLNEKEFVALWDSLLNGIRPRSMSLWGDTTKK